MAVAIFLVFGGGIFTGAILVVAWVMNNPDKAEKVYGWVANLVSKAYGKADRAAVAWRVQGDINTAREELLKSAPKGLIERRIRIKWAKAGEAEALLKEGEVLVCMEKAEHHEQNVANALMVFLPQTMLPKARRYLDAERMRAADLIVAKGLLDQDGSKPGALSIFTRDHLDPARAEGAVLREKIDELDDVDLQGWLARLLLLEYLRLGEALHPSEPDTEAARDAEEFARWLSRLAARAPGDDELALTYRGRYFKVAVIFVGIKETLADKGVTPYRARAKRFIYREHFDAVYLMARDHNMPAVELIADDLEGDGRIASVSTFRYALRPDFEARYGLARRRAIISCLRRRRMADEPPAEVDADLEEIAGIQVEAFEPPPPEAAQEVLFDGEEAAPETQANSD
jgi:hypothetical protein